MPDEWAARGRWSFSIPGRAAIPSELALDAIRPLANLPVFFKLTGRRVVVAGGSEAAAWKAELLAASGANVAAFAPFPPPQKCWKRRNAIRRSPFSCGPGPTTISMGRRLRSRTPPTPGRLRRSPRRRGGPARPSTSSTNRTIATSRSERSSTVRPSSSVFRPTAPTRVRPGAAGSDRGFRSPPTSPPGRKRRGMAPQFSELGAAFRQRRNFWERFATLALSSAGRKPAPEDRDRLLALSVDEKDD